MSGMVATHVSTPVHVYMQTPQQQVDYAKLKNCLAQTYASSEYRPSLVAAKMVRILVAAAVKKLEHSDGKLETVICVSTC